MTQTFVNKISGFITPLDLQAELSNRRERIYARAHSSHGAGEEHKLLPEETQGRNEKKASGEVLHALWSFCPPPRLRIQL